MPLEGAHLLATGSLSAEDGEENDSRPPVEGGSILGSQYRNLFWNKMVDPIQISPPGLAESS